MSDRVINLKKLPDGRVLIHWFRRYEGGPITTQSEIHMTERGPLMLGGAVGGIACRPEQNTIATQQVGNNYYPCIAPDDPRATTCPGCRATKEWQEAMKPYGEGEAA